MPTLNGRVYPQDLMRKAIAKLEAVPLPAFTHAQNNDIQHMLGVVQDIRVEGDYLCGTVVLADTDAGRPLQALAEAGANIPLRPIGVGSISNRGGWTVVNEDYQLLGFSLDSEVMVCKPGNLLRRVGRKKALQSLRQRNLKLVPEAVRLPPPD